MRRVTLTCLGWTLTLLLSTSAGADPVQLTITGTAFGVRVNDTIDVTNGFTGTSIPLTNVPIGALPAGGDPSSSPHSLDSTINLFAGVGPLNSQPGTGATLDLFGTITGSYSRPPGDPDIQGGASGSATASNLTLQTGTNAADVPPWFPGLSASVSANVTGGFMNILQSTLFIGPGTAPPPEFVPEPTSIAGFLACVGYLVKRSRSRTKPEVRLG